MSRRTRQPANRSVHRSPAPQRAIWALMALVLLAACNGARAPAVPTPAETPSAPTVAPTPGALSGTTGAVATPAVPTRVQQVVPTPTAQIPTSTAVPSEPPRQVWARVRPQFDALYGAFRQAFIDLQRLVPPPDPNDERKPAPNDGSWRQGLPSATGQFRAAERDLETFGGSRDIGTLGAAGLTTILPGLITEAQALAEACDAYARDGASWQGASDELASVDAQTFALVSAVDRFERALSPGMTAPAAPSGAWVDPGRRYALLLPPDWQVDTTASDVSGRVSYISTGDDVTMTFEVRPRDSQAVVAGEELRKSLAINPDGSYVFEDSEMITVAEATGIRMAFRQAGENPDADATSGAIWIIDRGRLQYKIMVAAGGPGFRRRDDADAIVKSITFLA